MERRNIYHAGNRDWQDKFDSRRLADRLQELTVHDEIDDQDRAFIEARDMFFISTVDQHGRPTVSYKGGDVGFVRIVDNKTLALPGYDGNGMILTAGNIASNNHVGLLFIVFENPMRIRLHGAATVHADDPLLEVPGYSGLASRRAPAPESRKTDVKFLENKGRDSLFPRNEAQAAVLPPQAARTTPRDSLDC